MIYAFTSSAHTAKRAGFVALAGIFALAACDQQPVQMTPPATSEETVAAVETPVAEPVVAPAYNWTPTNGAVINTTVSPVELTVSGTDMAFAVFRDFSVAAGDDIIATAKVSGAAGEKVRVLLQRHCNSENGSDANGNILTFTGGEDTVQVAQVFTADYSCIRVSFLNPEEGTLNLQVSDITIAKRN
jgi:hypothetical protein